ncbi:hypothetical protein ZWY2020_020812 [Hordeum vulgare]|nr:hypothetical protein ZWY2020_020812 [Hordeum vulgare]
MTGRSSPRRRLTAAPLSLCPNLLGRPSLGSARLLCLQQLAASRYITTAEAEQQRHNSNHRIASIIHCTAKNHPARGPAVAISV